MDRLSSEFYNQAIIGLAKSAFDHAKARSQGLTFEDFIKEWIGGISQDIYSEIDQLLVANHTFFVAQLDRRTIERNEARANAESAQNRFSIAAADESLAEQACINTDPTHPLFREE